MSLPVSASEAEMYPRTPYSAPALPITTIPLAMRGALVIEVWLGLVGCRYAPHGSAGMFVECDQAAIERPEVDLAFVTERRRDSQHRSR